MSKYTNIIFFIILSSIINSSWADTLIVVDNENPPFMYGEEGKAQGLYPLMLNTIFKEMGEPLTIKAMPWKRVLSMGENGEAGIGGIYQNEERLKIYDYSKPIFEEKLVIFVQKDKSFDFKTVADLKGKNIAVINGWSYGTEFDTARKAEEFSVQEARSDDSNFKKLEAGRVDAVVAIEMSGRKIIKDQALEGKIVALDMPLVVNPTYVVFAKKVNKLELIDRFNNSLQKLQEEGKIDETIKQALSAN